MKRNESIENHVPQNSLKYFDNLHFIEDYFDIIKYKILTDNNLSKYCTVDEGIDCLLKKVINKSNTYEELIKNIKSKRYTYNKITRMILHILCNFTKDKKDLFKDISYIRILGFNDQGKSYLNKIKKDIDVPIISKITRNKDKMLEFELETTSIYNLKGNKCIEENKIIYKGEKNDKE